MFSGCTGNFILPHFLAVMIKDFKPEPAFCRLQTCLPTRMEYLVLHRSLKISNGYWQGILKILSRCKSEPIILLWFQQHGFRGDTSFTTRTPFIARPSSGYPNTVLQVSSNQRFHFGYSRTVAIGKIKCNFSFCLMF